MYYESNFLNMMTFISEVSGGAHQIICLEMREAY